MLLVKPTAKRLPDTVDVNLSNFIENSPMFNNGLKLAASQLIRRSIEKQASNRYLKPTPIYFDGAGTEAVIAGGSTGLPSAEEGLGDEASSLGSALTGIDSIERIPRQVAGPQPLPEQLVAVQTSSRPSAGGGFPPATRTVSPKAPSPAALTLVAMTPVDVLPPISHDVPGAPKTGKVTLVATNISPTRGFLEEFRLDPSLDNPDSNAPDTIDNVLSSSFWVPFGTNNERYSLITGRFPDVPADGDTKSQRESRGTRDSKQSAATDGELGSWQAVPDGSGGSPIYLIFQEVKLTNKNAAKFLISPLSEKSKITLKFSHDDVPSDILTGVEFKRAFTTAHEKATGVEPPQPDFPTHANVGLDDFGNEIREEIGSADLGPPQKDITPAMDLIVPPKAYR